MDILMDNHVMVNLELSKRVSADQLLVLIDHRLRSIIEKPHSK